MRKDSTGDSQWAHERKKTALSVYTEYSASEAGRKMEIIQPESNCRRPLKAAECGREGGREKGGGEKDGIMRGQRRI